jgi:hypothetical protein
MKRSAIVMVLGMLIGVSGLPLQATADDDPTKAPAPPMNLQAWGDGTNILLAWDPPLHEGFGSSPTYNVYATRTGLPMERVGEALTEAGFAYEPEDDSDPVVFYVTAVNEFGESAPSNAAGATPRWPYCGVIFIMPPMIVHQCLFPLPV